MCYGAQATDCWTFATTKENKIPCMIPMVEETEGCVEGLDSRLKFSKYSKIRKLKIKSKLPLNPAKAKYVPRYRLNLNKLSSTKDMLFPLALLWSVKSWANLLCGEL